jgi:Flp pilus assembly protein TadG
VTAMRRLAGQQRPALGRLPGDGRQRGAVTVELAAAIPLLVAITLALVGVVVLASDQVLVQGAAREGAREAAISGDTARAVAAARSALPPRRGATVSVVRLTPDRVKVEIRMPARLVPGPGVTLAATAVAAVEPGPAPDPVGA